MEGSPKIGKGGRKWGEEVSASAEPALPTMVLHRQSWEDLSQLLAEAPATCPLPVLPPGWCSSSRGCEQEKEKGGPSSKLKVKPQSTDLESNPGSQV
jgi:hypothetical protein